MPLPPAAEAARQAAMRQQTRRNALAGLIVTAFIGSVFTYVITAVEHDPVTEAELRAFRAERERQRAADARR